MGKITRYIVLIWNVPDYGIRDAIPYLFENKKELMKFLEKKEDSWEYLDVFKVDKVFVRK